MNFKYLLLTAILVLVMLFKSNAQIGGTMSFDGKQFKYDGICGTYLDIQGVFATNAPQAFTMEYKINPTTLTNYNQQMGVNKTFIIHAYGDGQLKAAQNTGEGFPNYARAVANTLVTNTWQHFAIVYDATVAGATTMKIYKNGSLVASSGNFIETGVDVRPIPAWTAGFQVGYYNEQGLNASLDEFRIWNKARTQEEINATMNVEITNPSASSDLEVYCNFNDQSSPSAMVRNLAKPANTVTYYNHYVNSVTVSDLKKLQITLSGTGATLSTGSIRIYEASTNILVATLDKTLATTTASPFVYDVSSFGLTFSTAYKVVVGDGAFYSPAKGISGAFTKTITTPAYLYALNTITTYPTVNGSNIPVNLQNITISFSNSAVTKPTTMGNKITIRDNNWGVVAFVDASQTIQNTSPFTYTVGAALSAAQKYTIVVDAGAFLSTDGTEENQRIWSFNTIATTASNLAMTCGGGKYGSFVDVVTNTATGVPISPNFTEELWLRIDAMPTTYNELMTGLNDSKTRPPVIFLYTNKQVQFGFGNGTTWYSYTPTVGFELGWNHIAATFDGSVYNFYCNGILQYTTTASSGKTFTNNQLLYLGKSITGLIDEVKVWNKALDLNELRTSMYSTYTKSQAEGISNLVGYWNFDDAKPFSEDLSRNNISVQVVGDLVANDNTAFTQFVYQATTAPTGTLSARPVVKLLFDRAVNNVTGKLKFTNVTTGVSQTIDILTATTTSLDAVANATTGYRELSLVTTLDLPYNSVYSVDFVGVKVFDFSGNVISTGFIGSTFTTQSISLITEFAVVANAVPSSAIAINSTATGTLRYLIRKASDVAPTFADLKLSNNTVDLTANVRNTTKTIGVMSVGSYVVYGLITFGSNDITVSSNFTMVTPVVKASTIVPARTAVGASLMGDRGGRSYAVVVDYNGTIPVNTSIVNSTYSISMDIANSPYNVSVSNLIKNTKYNLCAVMTDAAGNVSSVSVYTFSTTNEFIFPTITSLVKTSVGQISATFDVVCAEDATLYYQALPVTTTAPNATTLTTSASSVSALVQYEKKQSLLIANLERGTAYNVYVIAKNTAGTSAIYSFTLTTTIGVPTLNIVGGIMYPSIYNARLNLRADRVAGKYSWILLNATQAAPTSGTDLIAMATTPTSAIVTSGQFNATAITAPINMYGLRSNTSYTCYVVLTDGTDISQMFVNTFTTPSWGTDVATDLSNKQFVVYPNPATDKITLAYTLTESTTVSIDLYTALGTKVRTVENAKKSAGDYKVTVDINDLSNGVYIYQLRTDKDVTTQQVIINR